MKYAAWSFGLSQRQENGSTLRAYLEASAKRGNLASRRALEPPPLPTRFAYFWGWFLELHGRRGSGMHGPAALTWGDFDAWARRTRRNPTPWEFSVLSALDEAFFASIPVPQPKKAH